MVLIFSASSDSNSAQHSSQILAPIIRWLFPHLPEQSVSDLVFFFRKCAHLTEYALLALLIWRGLRKPVRKDLRPWHWADARVAVFIVALYAATDEFHQLFVPTREGRVSDVLIDTAGGFGGMLGLWIIGKLCRQW